MDATVKQRHDSGMPLDLTDAELATAATACRAMAYQEDEPAKKMEKPTMRRPVESNAKRFAVLAEKFEAARATSRRVSAIQETTPAVGELANPLLRREQRR
jgi:sugar (pentulose or hexulose) kinase